MHSFLFRFGRTNTHAAVARPAAPFCFVGIPEKVAKNPRDPALGLPPFDASCARFIVGARLCCAPALPSSVDRRISNPQCQIYNEWN
jgi:hypothetical protein